MKKFIIIVIAYLSLNSSLLILNTGAQWVQMSNGINGASINCIEKAGNSLFVGTDVGLYKSNNSGMNWERVNTFTLNESILSILSNGTDLFVGTDINVYKSTNNGINWIESTNPGFYGYNNSVIKAKNDTVFVGTLGNGIFKSSDGGNNWIEINNELNSVPVCAIFFLNNLIYAGTYAGYYTSSNGGLNWTFANNEMSYKEIYDFAENGNSFFAASNYGLFRSTNSGINWIKVSNYLNATGVERVIVLNNLVFAGTNTGGVYRSSDDGNNWVQINNGIDDWYSLSFLKVDSTLFYGTYGSLYLSSNNGNNWVTRNQGLKNLRVNNLVSSSTKLYSAIPYAGIYETSDDGMNWNQITSHVEYNSYKLCSFYSLFVKDSLMITNSINGPIFYNSTNYGSNWNITNITNTYVITFEIKNDTLYCFSSSKIYRSTDMGRVWTLIFSFTGFVNDIEVTGNKFYAATTQGLFYSTNNGLNWTSLGIAETVNSIKSDGNDLFAGKSGNGIYYSSNNGLNWIPRNSGIMSNSAFDINISNNIIYINTWDGIYISTNKGLTWINKNQGLEYSFSTKSKLYNNYIFCGTEGNGIWRRDISEIIGIENISTEIPSKYSLGQNYPNPFNPMCNVQFSMCNAGNVKLVVYDVQGREVQTLVNERLQPGKYEATFDGSRLNSGVYFYKLITDRYTETKKMLLVK